MGNSCFTCPKNVIKEIKINICLDKQSMNTITEQIINNKDTNNEKREGTLVVIQKYFNENEREIINSINQKEKIKRSILKKKRESMLTGTVIDNKYELMLKRLLEQKKIKRNGPKRRETIRGDNKIGSLVKEVLNNNKIEIKNSKKKKNELNKKSTNRDSFLLIKNKKHCKMRAASTIDKSDVTNNKHNRISQKLYNHNLKNVNTLNELINEGNCSVDLGKKETDKK